MGVFQRGGKWYAQYFYKGTRIRESVASSEREAQNYLARRKAEILEGRFQFPRISSITFGEFAREYMEYSRVNKRSWRRDVTSFRHLMPYFGHYLLEAIKPMAIEQYKAFRREKAKPASINVELSLMHHLYTKAIQEGYAFRNPLNHMKLFRLDNRMDRVLSPEEIQRLLAACSDHFRPVVQVALHTAMRRSEVLGLTWDRVDFTPGQETITILRSKSGRMRRIPINSALLPVLRELKLKTGPEGLVFPFRGMKRPVPSFRTSWHKALRASGIRYCRYHDLRHTAASHMVSAGVDLVRVMELLGHQDLITTLKYAHTIPEEKRRAVELLKERYSIAGGRDAALGDDPGRRTGFQIQPQKANQESLSKG